MALTLRLIQPSSKLRHPAFQDAFAMGSQCVCASRETPGISYNPAAHAAHGAAFRATGISVTEIRIQRRRWQRGWTDSRIPQMVYALNPRIVLGFGGRLSPLLPLHRLPSDRLGTLPLKNEHLPDFNLSALSVAPTLSVEEC